MKKNGLIALVSVIAAITMVFSLYMIADTLITGKQEQNAFDELTALVAQEKEKPENEQQSFSDQKPHTAGEKKPDSAEPVMLPEYAAVYEQNHDFFGWLRIDDTPINYPVMYTPEDPQYYLRRAFDRSDSRSGTPFLDAACYEGCGNYIIYGHHMKNDTMFGTLLKYAEKDYWEKHRTIHFDTLYTHDEYEVIAAFYGRAFAKGESGFRYYQYTDLTNPDTFEEFIAQVNAAAIYDTGITAEFGDALITLSTCSYHTDNGRLAVVARKTEN